MKTTLTRTLILSLMLSACGTSEESAPNQIPPTINIEAPQMDKLVIYEVFVRNFTTEGTFQAMIPKLDRLKELGVNTLWLMPIHPIGELNKKGSLGSPYSIRDFYDVHPDFGTKEDFRTLVNACHERGMYIIIDLVANHSSFDNAWVSEHPSWYVRDDSGEILPPDPDWTDVADLDYNNPEVPAAMSKVMEYWVKEFDIDGYRCDVAYMVPFSFWESSITNIRKIKPIIMLAEGAGTELHEAGFDYTYGWEIYHHLKKIFAGESTENFSKIAIEETGKVPSGNKIMRFITNHDETSWDDVPVSLFKSREGSMAAFVASCMLPCVPLIYNGQEVGHNKKMNLFEKSSISWSKNPHMQAFYQRFLQVYAEEPSLRTDEVHFFDTDNPDIIAFRRGKGDEAIYVLVNVRASVVKFNLPEEMRSANLLNLMNNGSMPLHQELLLNGFEFYILKAAQAS
ncbi:MAG: alpha-amylase family glycosyl hydrolase [Bacteroidia bacterium]